MSHDENIPAADPSHVIRERFGLDVQALEKTLGQALERRADFADLFFEHRTQHSVSLDEGIVKKAGQHVLQGVGVRVLAGEKTGYAFSDEVSIENLEYAAENARAIAASPGEVAAVDLRESRPEKKHDLCLLYTSPSPRDVEESRMPSSA